MSDLEEAYAEFWEDLLRYADASGEPQLACFFESYAPLAAENGDCGDLNYTPVRKDGWRQDIRLRTVTQSILKGGSFILRSQTFGPNA